MPPEWFYGLAAVAIGGAVLPALLSGLLDALALGIQRRRWRPLVRLVAAVAATDAALTWTLSRARTSPTAYEIHWPVFVALLFSVGMVVTLWHGIPRVMRAVRRRRREDREHLVLAAVDPAELPYSGPATAEPVVQEPVAAVSELTTITVDRVPGALVLAD